MKALKGSLVALVAIFAVGLTVAMQAGAFESKAPVRVADCFPLADVANPSASCFRTIYDAAALTPPTCAAVNPTIVGRPVFALSTSPIDAELDCLGAKNKFCCVKVVSGTQLCSQPQINPEGDQGLAFYRVASVECKP